MYSKRTIFLLGLITSVAAFAATEAAFDIEVDQVGKKFSKESVALPAGGVIRFRNSDDVTHNITIVDGEGEPADKGMQTPGQSIDVKMLEPGKYQARCSIHPRMKMNVQVTAKQ